MISVVVVAAAVVSILERQATTTMNFVVHQPVSVVVRNSSTLMHYTMIGVTHNSILRQRFYCYCTMALLMLKALAVFRDSPHPHYYYHYCYHPRCIVISDPLFVVVVVLEISSAAAAAAVGEHFDNYYYSDFDSNFDDLT